MTTYHVTIADTAQALGSGDVPVLATPRLIAWLEAETCLVAAPLLTPDRTTVGIRVTVDHLAATPVGASVDVAAAISASDDRTIEFSVEAYDVEKGTVLAQGKVQRAIVNRERFLARLS